MATAKTQVIEHLYNMHLHGHFPNGIVHQSDVKSAIRATGANLSTNNPANFLKDIIRKDSANSQWPATLVADGVTARQRYGNKKVFQFVQLPAGQTEPFPDRFLPDANTPIQRIQSASVPFAARQLGRKEESWLMQVIATLRVLENQLSVFSPVRHRLRDITHLQMSMKTQPEIDAVYLVSHSRRSGAAAADDLFTVVTCEAKQRGERLLEDQIREQVSQAFKVTKKIEQPEITGVKPIAVQAKQVTTSAGTVNGIYVAEFQRVTRKSYEEYFRPTTANPECLYNMDLRVKSDAFYVPTPAIEGIN